MRRPNRQFARWVNANGGAVFNDCSFATAALQAALPFTPAGGGCRARIRTRRAEEAGSASRNFIESSTLCTDLRSLQMGSTSQPASSARCARTVISPKEATPPMRRSSEKTQP